MLKFIPGILLLQVITIALVLIAPADFVIAQLGWKASGLHRHSRNWRIPTGMLGDAGVKP